MGLPPREAETGRPHRPPAHGPSPTTYTHCRTDLLTADYQPAETSLEATEPSRACQMALAHLTEGHRGPSPGSKYKKKT